MKQSVALINAYKGLDNDHGPSLLKHLTSDHPAPPKVNNLFMLEPPASIFSSSPSQMMMMSTEKGKPSVSKAP